MGFFWVPRTQRISIWVIVAIGSVLPLDARLASPSPGLGERPWSSEVKLRRLPKSLRGILTISNDGVEFRPDESPAMHWAFEDVQTIDLANPRSLSLMTYQNNRWHLPGDRPFEFSLEKQMPPEVAAEFVRRVSKPAINGDPYSELKSFGICPARHKTRMGGSIGLLRFTESGIDYLSKAGDSRSWRWSDLETLANPEPYRLRVGAYLETFDFELKQSLTSGLFDRLWDHIYAQGLKSGDSNE